MTQSDLPTDTSDFGKRLRAQRESKHLTLEDIGNRLRLKPELVHCLESGDFGTGAPPIFMRGYLRSYARLLGFTDEDIHNALSTSGLVVNTGTPSAPRVNNHPVLNTDFIPWVRWITFTLMLALALSVIVWWNAYPVTVVREALMAHLSLPAAQSSSPKEEDVTASTTDVPPAEPAVPASPEASLTLPNSIDMEPAMAALNQDETDSTDPSP